MYAACKATQGTWKGVRVSVMASGMGIPSIGIYSYELFNFFGVENILRIGSAGACQNHVRLRDIVIGMGACTNSAYAAQYQLPGAFAPIADLRADEHCNREMHVRQAQAFHVGNLLSSDTFYTDDATALSKWIRMGVLAVEMEAAGPLYERGARRQAGAGRSAQCRTIS